MDHDPPPRRLTTVIERTPTKRYAGTLLEVLSDIFYEHKLHTGGGKRSGRRAIRASTTLAEDRKTSRGLTDPCEFGLNLVNIIGGRSSMYGAWRNGHTAFPRSKAPRWCNGTSTWSNCSGNASIEWPGQNQVKGILRRCADCNRRGAPTLPQIVHKRYHSANLHHRMSRTNHERQDGEQTAHQPQPWLYTTDHCSLGIC